MFDLSDLIQQQRREQQKGDRTATLQTPPWRNGARVYRTTNQSTASGAFVPISFDAARFNYSSVATLMWVIGSPTRLTCVIPGVYEIFGNVVWDTNATGIRILTILLNGVTNIAVQNANPTAAAPARCIVGCTYELAVGNYIELTAYQNVAAPLNVLTVANYSPEFSAWRKV